MSDRIKEFVNTTYTLADVNTSTNKIVLIATDATTQAVVKDIAIKNEDINGTISLNDYEISDAIESMSGSEIVDTESELALNIPVPFGITLTRPEILVPVTAFQNIGITYMTSASSITQAPLYTTLTSDNLYFTRPTTPSFVVTGTTLTEGEVLNSYSNVITNTQYVNTFVGDLATAKETCPLIGVANTYTTASSASVAGMNSPAWAYKHSNGNLYYFYYNGNNVNYLHFSTNAGSSWYDLDTSSGYGYKCISPAGRISWVAGTIFYSVVPGGTGSTSVQLAGRITGNYSTGSYTHASECNGWHFWIPSTSYSNILYGYHKDRNIAVTINMNSPMLVSSDGGLCVTYNEAENKYFVFSWSGYSSHLHRVETNIEAIANGVTSTGTGTFLVSGGIDHYGSYATTSQWIPGTKNMMFKNSSNRLMITEFSSTGPYYTTPVVLANITVSTGGAVLSTTPEVLDSSFTVPGQVIDAYSYLDTSKTITARVTGVETKLA